MRQLLSLSALVTALLSVGCSHQPVDQYADEFQQLQTSATEHQTQVQQINQSQQQLLQELQRVQQQLIEQQKACEARPQIIERITRTECPPVAQKQAQSVPKSPDTDKQIVGLQEKILLTGVDLVMSAKITPQLSYSILDARNIQMFERNSDEWVRFTLYNPDTKEPHVLERKLIGFQNITGANKTAERRPIVEVRFTIGKLTQRGQFVLTDRSSSSFAVAVGRNLLRDVMLVDVAGENLAPLKREDKKDDKKPEEKSEKKSVKQ